MIRTEHRDHTIMKRILSLLALILLICSPDMEAKADRQQEPDSVAAPVLLEGKKKTEAANRISSGYSDWKSVDMSGKITSLNFFIKPSLKLYMKRGELIMLSVRVPLKGEVARLEADKDSILIVNKLNRTYIRESIGQLTKIAAVTLSDIQDIFLGRVFIAGRGTLTKKDARRIDIYEEPGAWLAVPKDQPDDSLVHYGFRVLPDGKVSLLMLSSLFDEATAQLEYSYSGKSSELEFTFDRKSKTFGLTFELSSPKWNAKGFERLIPGSDLRQVSPKEFIKMCRL